RNEHRHRLATFGDQHRFALGLDFIHDRQTMDLENSRRHFLHGETSFRSWSLYHSHNGMTFPLSPRLNMSQLPTRTELTSTGKPLMPMRKTNLGIERRRSNQQLCLKTKVAGPRIRPCN